VRIEGIVGMEDEEALDLVAELMTHATPEKIRIPPPMTLWRLCDLGQTAASSTRPNPDYDMNERRYLYRLMLKGETPV